MGRCVSCVRRRFAVGVYCDQIRVFVPVRSPSSLSAVCRTALVQDSYQKNTLCGLPNAARQFYSYSIRVWPNADILMGLILMGSLIQWGVFGPGISGPKTHGCEGSIVGAIPIEERMTQKTA